MSLVRNVVPRSLRAIAYECSRRTRAAIRVVFSIGWMMSILTVAVGVGQAQGGPTVTVSPGSATFTTGNPVNVTIDYCSARPFDMGTHSITVNGANVTSSFNMTGAIPPGCIYGMRGTGTVSITDAMHTTILAMIEDVDGYLGGGNATYTYIPPGFVREAHAVWVTPATYARQSWPSTWNSTDFVVANEGTRAGTYNLGVACAAAASSCSVSPTSVYLDTTSTGRTQTVAVTYYAGATQGDTGRIKLTATNSQYSAAWDTTTTELHVVTVSPPRPVGVEIIGDGNVRNRSLCLTVAAGTDGAYECGDLRLAHGLPAVRTRNQMRQLTLLYNSAQARAFSTVSADVTLPSSQGTPQYVEARLWHNGVQLASGSWTGSQWGTGVTRRIALGFDATNFGSEFYAMQFEVAYLWGNNTWTTDWPTANVPIVNRASSPFGAGWWIAGVEQLIHRGDDSYLRIGGDGTTARYSRVSGTNVWRAPGYSGPDSLFQDGSGNIRRRLPAGAHVVFNSQGQHIRTEPLVGPATEYQYDGSGRLTTVILPSGTTSARYNVSYSSGAYSIELNAGGYVRTSSFAVPNGRLTQITEPDNRQVYFGYGTGIDDARITSRTDRLGAVTYYAYDAARKLISHSLTLADNSVIAKSFQPAESRGFPGTTNAAAQHPDSAYTRIDGPRSDVADVTHVWLNGHGAPTRTRDAHGWETDITYDATFPALPKEVRSPGGAVSKAWYNWRGLVDSSAVLNLRSPGDPAAVSRVTWHPSLALATATTSATGDVTMNGYNADGTMQWAQPGTSAARRSYFYYHASGAGAGLYQYSTVPGTSATDNVAYDAALGNVSAVTNRLQKTSSVAQDEFGRVRATVSEFASGKFRTDSTYYDLLGRDTLNVSRADPAQYTPQYVQTGTVTMPVMTLKVSQRYDAEGQLTEVTRWSVPDPAAANVMRNTYIYDRAGRKTQEFRAGGGTDMPLITGSQFLVYDPAGNLIQHQEGSVVRTMTYDALGRLKRRATQAQSYAVKHCSTLDPNGVNGPCYFSFPLSTGGTTGITFDADAELFTYDRAGNMTRANNQHALIDRTYSPGGLLLTDTLRIRKLLYATSGSVVPSQDFTQHVYGIGYTYNAAGRRSTLKFPDQLDPCSGYACPAQQYAYDSPGTGLLTGITDIRGQNFGFSYTDAGQLQYLTYPGNVQEQILQYDAEGSPVVRHVTLAGSAWIADTVTYDPVGRPTTIRGKNLSSFGSQVLLNAYTGLGALAMYEFDNGGTPRLEQYWTDGLATQYEVRRHNIKLAQSENNPTIRFSRYVGDGKVARDSSEIPPNNSYIDYTDYFYDFEGRTRHSYTRTNDYNAGTNDYVQSASYYDGNGRLALFERHLGDMQQASLGNDPRAVVESYRYDALGRRVLTHALRASNCTSAGCESTVQRFVWDGDQLLYEVRVRGDSAAYSSGVEDDLHEGDGIYGAVNAYGRVGYTHAGGIDRPIGAVRGTTPFYPHTNSRGLYEAATVDNGSVLTNPVNWPGKAASAFLGWTTKKSPHEWFGSLVTEQADASGLMYRRNRYYDPKVGRFTQPDPIGIAGGLNSYGFAGGDPVNFSDPFGLNACPVDDYLCLIAKAGWETLGMIGGSLLGGGAGAVAGGACGGVGAVVCSPALAATGAVAGAVAGRKLAGDAFDNIWESQAGRRRGGDAKPNRGGQVRNPDNSRKEAGQQYEEISEAQRRARQRGQGDRINSTRKSRQRDRQELREEAEEAIRTRNPSEN